MGDGPELQAIHPVGRTARASLRLIIVNFPHSMIPLFPCLTLTSISTAEKESLEELDGSVHDAESQAKGAWFSHVGETVVRLLDGQVRL